MNLCSSTQHWPCCRISTKAKGTRTAEAAFESHYDSSSFSSDLHVCFGIFTLMEAGHRADGTNRKKCKLLHYYTIRIQRVLKSWEIHWKEVDHGIGFPSVRSSVLFSLFGAVELESRQIKNSLIWKLIPSEQVTYKIEKNSTNDLTIILLDRFLFSHAWGPWPIQTKTHILAILQAEEESFSNQINFQDFWFPLHTINQSNGTNRYIDSNQRGYLTSTGMVLIVVQKVKICKNTSLLSLMHHLCVWEG